MEKQEIIITIIVAIIGSGILNVFITHLLFGQKLKKERQEEYVKMLGEKICAAQLATRDLELQCESIEIYEIEKLLDDGGFDAHGRNAVYPAIFGSKESLVEFYDEVSNVRKAYEKYLDYSIAAHLLYIERYCMDLLYYLGEQGISTKEAGLVFGIDIQAWRQSLEKILVRKINHPTFKIYDKNNKRWEKAKKKVDQDLYQKSILKKLKDNNDTP